MGKDYFRARELIVLKLPEGEKLGIYKLCIYFSQNFFSD